MMCSDCAHLRTTSRTCSLIDSFPVGLIVTPSRPLERRHSLNARQARRQIKGELAAAAERGVVLLMVSVFMRQKAQLSPRDRVMRRVS